MDDDDDDIMNRPKQVSARKQAFGEGKVHDDFAVMSKTRGK